MTNLEEKTPEETFKEIMERFDEVAYHEVVYGNPTGTPDGFVQCKAFLKDSLVEFGESLIGEDEDLSTNISQFFQETRNNFRSEQRQELEKISK